MKTNIRLILVVAIIILSVTALIAQTKDIVYLKNGSVIKGTILEMVPDKTIKVQTADGNIFVYNMSEVEKISKEAAAPAPSNEPKPFIEQRGNENQRGYEGQSSSEGSGAKFSIYGGISLPMGNFAKKEGSIYENGYAKLGWSAGIQFVTGGTIGWIIDGNYSQNKFDLPTSATTIPGKYEWVGWSSILALTGIKIGTDNSTGTNFFIAPLVGAMFATSPKLDFTPAGSSTSIPELISGKGTAVAYGGAVQVIFGGHVTLNAKYIVSKPKFKYSSNGQDYENDPQSITFLLVSLGVAF
jgi:hypothetical protein